MQSAAWNGQILYMDAKYGHKISSAGVRTRRPMEECRYEGKVSEILRQLCSRAENTMTDGAQYGSLCPKRDITN